MVIQHCKLQTILEIHFSPPTDAPFYFFHDSSIQETMLHLVMILNLLKLLMFSQSFLAFVTLTPLKSIGQLL